MSVETNWEHFFKPEVRKAGESLLKKGAVFLKLGSDVQVDSYIRGSTSAKVSFRSDSISSNEFSVDCSCALSKKGQFCKHIWATLLLVENKTPDFLESKTSFEKVMRASSSSATAQPLADTVLDDTVSPRAKVISQSQIDYKKRQADFRKQAYQDQKQRMKLFKSKTVSSKKVSFKEAGDSQAIADLPDRIRAAANYFKDNGFPMAPPFDDVAVNQAKRVLSTVFHPDRGGTHEEMLELLGHAKALLGY